MSIKVALKEGTADTHAKKMQEVWASVKAQKDLPSFIEMMEPKIEAKDGNLVIGWKQHMKKTPLANMSEMVAGKLTHTGQHMHYNVSFASSLEDIMNSEKSVIHEIQKGFAVESKVCLISEIRKALMKLTENNDNANAQQLSMFAMMAPATMFTMQGTIDFEFDSIEELAAHPMAGPFMVGFNELFEGAVGKSTDEALEITIDTEGKELPASFQSIIDCLLSVESLTTDIADHLHVEVNVPSSLIHTCIDIKAPGLGKAAKLGLKAGVFTKLVEQLEYM